MVVHGRDGTALKKPRCRYELSGVVAPAMNVGGLVQKHTRPALDVLDRLSMLAEFTTSLSVTCDVLARLEKSLTLK